MQKRVYIFTVLVPVHAVAKPITLTQKTIGSVQFFSKETTWTGSDNPVTVSIYLQTLVAYIDAGMQPYYQSESVSVQVRVPVFVVRVPVYVVLVLIWYSTCIVLVDGKQ